MLRGAIKIAILAVVVYKVADILLKAGVFNNYKKHHPGECRHVKGLDFGSEDFQITKDGLAFITSGVWVPTMSAAFVEFVKANNVQGNIYLYDFKNPDLGARKLKLKHSNGFNPGTFHPHGISLLEDEVKGEHLIYVISHREDDDAVEKFRYLPKSSELVHLKSFSGNELQITNDLAVFGEDTFYITNCLYFKNSFLSLLEHTVIPFSLGSLAFFNGTDFTLVETALNSPNGIYLSKDHRYLYVNLPFSGTIEVYEIRNNNHLVKLQSVALHTMADNLHLSQSGDALYIGAHPIAYKAMQHLQDPRQQAPSSVLKLPLKDGIIDSENIVELFYDHGKLINGSSVAAVYNNQLLIGSVIDKLVICDVNIPI